MDDWTGAILARHGLLYSTELLLCGGTEQRLDATPSGLIAWLACEMERMTDYPGGCSLERTKQGETESLILLDDSQETLFALDITPLDETCILRGTCWQTAAWPHYRYLIERVSALFRYGDGRISEMPDEDAAEDAVKQAQLLSEALDYFGEPRWHYMEQYDAYLGLAREIRSRGYSPPFFEEYIIGLYRQQAFGEPWVCPLPESEGATLTPAEAGAEMMQPEPDAGGEAEGNPTLARIKNPRDRELVRLWREGLKAGEIACELGTLGYPEITSKTVTNRLCDLRKAFGPDAVPYKQPPRNRDSQGPESG